MGTPIEKEAQFISSLGIKETYNFWSLDNDVCVSGTSFEQM